MTMPQGKLADAGLARAANAEQAGAQRASAWPLLVIGLIVMNMFIVAFTIVKAASDPSGAIEPNYYDKALHFDEIKAEKQASDAAGWQASITLERVDAPVCKVSVSLTDALGRPLSQCDLQLTAFAHVRASERIVREMSMRDVASDPLACTLRVSHEGLWTFSIRAQQGDRVHVSEHILTMPAYTRSGQHE